MKERTFCAKRHCFAATVFALGALSQAHAQSSVTIYGRVDVGVQYQNRSANDAGSLTALHTGGIRPSIWGFRGTEDLGGGLKASFNLEAQFDSSTGSSITQPGNSNQIFRRQANVGLGGDWGTVQLGRMYSPLIFGTIGVEPRAWKEQFSQLGPLVYNSLSGPGNPNGAGTNTSNDVGVFIGNAVTYSGNFGPVYLGVGYSFGEQSGGFSRGSQISVGASYTGPVVLGAGYHKVKDDLSGVAVHDLYDIGVAVPLGLFTGRVNYFSAENNDPTTSAKVSDLDSLGLGLDFKWNDQNTLGLAYYHSRYKGGATGAKATTKSLVISNDYAISKRTTIYAQFAYEDADAVVNPADALEYLKRTIVIGATAPAGEKTSLLSVGISHNF